MLYMPSQGNENELFVYGMTTLLASHRDGPTYTPCDWQHGQKTNRWAT